jgi:hypothetical protein
VTGKAVGIIKVPTHSNHVPVTYGDRFQITVGPERIN